MTRKKEGKKQEKRKEEKKEGERESKWPEQVTVNKVVSSTLHGLCFSFSFQVFALLESLSSFNDELSYGSVSENKPFPPKVVFDNDISSQP